MIHINFWFLELPLGYIFTSSFFQAEIHILIPHKGFLFELKEEKGW